MLRKVMYHCGTPAQRVLIKGHFLIAAKVLEQQYPKAKFFAVMRCPTECICSFINLVKVLSIDNPGLMLLKPDLFLPSGRVIQNNAIATQFHTVDKKCHFIGNIKATNSPFYSH